METYVTELPNYLLMAYGFLSFCENLKFLITEHNSTYFSKFWNFDAQMLAQNQEWNISEKH